ncbi:MAG: lamin tail domain-containing protein [Candidatus Pacebacteria bacterium]|nr:lamin tail domain-containing protein [Candidatus Paceibacterota bacterium]
MEKFLKNSRFFYILTLICLAGFLVLPNTCLGYDLDNITAEEIGKYLELPEKDVQNLLFTLNQIFTTDWIYRESSTSATNQETLVPLILRKIVRIQLLNHLLVDAPIQVSWAIIKNATKITKLFLTQDPSVILNELEKESVEKAVAYGINFLLENEIRITPGAIEYEYISQGENKQKIIIQYILIYQPLDNKQGNLVIRFYSPQPIDPPKSEGAWGMIGTPHFVEGKLPPFIVDIRGPVENYQWVGSPLVQIDFPSEVPDSGIKPLSFCEKYLLKPITNKIKEVEILITKTVEKTPILSGIWDTIRSFLSEIINFSPANISKILPTAEEQSLDNKASGYLTVIETNKGLVEASPQQSKKEEVNEETVEASPQQTETTPTLEEMQEMLDDIAEEIDILTQKFAELMEEKQQEIEEEIDETDEENDEEKEDFEGEDVCFVDINAAPKEELQKITGIGSVLAQRIIEARPFYSLADLLRVSGIGEKTLQNIINQDCAYVDLTYVGSGMTSTGATPQSSPLSYPKILISEIQIESASSSDDEFIELYNPDNEEVDISQWSIQKTYCNSTTVYKKNFESNNTIPAKGYFLIVYASSTDQNLLNLADMTHKTFSLAKNNTIYLVVNQEKIENASDTDIIDMVGFGMDIIEFRSLPAEGNSSALNPSPSQSIGRKWSTTTQTYIDTDNNQNDFEIQNPTPKTQNQSLESEPGEEEEEEEEESTTLGVVINEIAWMGTNSSANDEWIELYNNTTSTIDITGWRLVSSDGSPDITFSTSSIPANDYYLIERTDDNTISNISADLIYVGDLGDGGERLELWDSFGNLIDLVDCSSDWFSGNSDTKRTMERINSNEYGSDSANWGNNNLVKYNGHDADNNFINGTPGTENSLSASETYIGAETLRFEEFNEITLTQLGNPYLIGTNSGGIFYLVVPEEKTLIIEPGVILKFKGNDRGGSAWSYYNSNLLIEGTLIAQGEEDNPIIFTSNMDISGSFGWWGQIYFTPSSQNSIFDYCQIRHGGKKESNSSIIIVDSTSIIFKNSILENFNVSGLKLIDSYSQVENITVQNGPSGSVINISGGAPIIAKSIFKNTYSGIIIGGGSKAEVTENYFEAIQYSQGALFVGDGYPILKDNTGKDNFLNGIYLFNSIAEDWTLYPNTDFPYIANFQVADGGNLIIEPGVVIKFEERKSLNIEGKLFAQGSLDKQIIFTSITDDEYGGDTNNDGSATQASSLFWNKVYFYQNNEGSLIKNARIRYGGIPKPSEYYRGVIHVVETGVVLEDIYFENDGPSGHTVYLENSSSSVRNCIFDNSEISKGTAITITGQDQNILENNSFQNFYCYIKKDGECILPLP